MGLVSISRAFLLFGASGRGLAARGLPPTMRRHIHHRSCARNTQFEALEDRRLMSAAGALDASFGQLGTANPFGFTTNDVAVGSDNKVIVVGELRNGFAVGRLDA